MDSDLNEFIRPVRRATIKDVARLAKVDPSLVSRVVNNDPKAFASASTRTRILKAVDDLGYQANLAARGLKMSKTQTIGFLIPNIGNPIYASIISGVEARCLELGYGIILGDHAEGDTENTFTTLLEQGRVDGLLIASGVLPDSYLKKVMANRTASVVLVNRKVEGFESSVIVNDELGVALAVKHFASNGSKIIAGIFGPTFIETAQRRRNGFQRACSESNLHPIIVDMPSLDMKAGFEAGKQIFALKELPDSIFVSTLLMAIGILRAAAVCGISIPDQVSLIAMHDSELAEYLNPPITTIKMPTYEMGRQSVDLLIELLTNQAPRHVMVSEAPKLIVRSSTRA